MDIQTEEAVAMNAISTNICRWGNSRGIRLPRAVLDVVGLNDHDEVTLTISGDSIIIRSAKKGARRDYPSLSDRFSGYTGDDTPEEWDVGSPVGEEL